MEGPCEEYLSQNITKVFFNCFTLLECPAVWNIHSTYMNVRVLFINIWSVKKGWYLFSKNFVFMNSTIVIAIAIIIDCGTKKML